MASLRYEFLALALLLTGCLSSGAQPTNAPPKARTELADAVVTLGFGHVSTFLPDSEALAQRARYGGTTDARRAMALAAFALVEAEGPESLAAIQSDVGVVGCSAACYFNRSSSLFGIVADTSSPLANQMLPSPPKGDVHRHWVFFLSVPDLSEHQYWALVSRDGEEVEVVSTN